MCVVCVVVLIFFADEDTPSSLLAGLEHPMH